MKALICLFILCGTYSTESASLGIPQQIAPCIDQPNDVLLPVFGECTQFYSCKNGKAILGNCLQDLHFDAETKNCTEASKSDCVQEQPLSISSEAKPNIPEIPDTPRYVCLGKAIGSLVPSRQNCSEYYSCISSRPNLQTCGRHLHFDSFSRSCILPADSNCVIKVRPTITTTRKPELIETVCKGMFDGEKFPVPGNCSKYFDCLEHKAYEKACDGEKHFYPVSRTCIDPDVSECFEGFVRVKPVSTDSNEIVDGLIAESDLRAKNGTDWNSVAGKKVVVNGSVDRKKQNTLTSTEKLIDIKYLTTDSIS